MPDRDNQYSAPSSIGVRNLTQINKRGSFKTILLEGIQLENYPDMPWHDQ